MGEQLFRRGRRQPLASGAWLGGDQVEGRQAVRELLAARRREVRDIWISESVTESPVVTEILSLADACRVPVRWVTRARFDAQARSAAPQGVLAHAHALDAAGLDELCANPSAFLLVLCGVTDPQNFGALLRSAEGAGVSGVVVGRHRAVHVTPAVTKAAAGAIEHVPIALVGGLAAALLRLSSRGVWRVGLAQDGDQLLWDAAFGAGPVAVVLGAEGAGLPRLVAQRCDVVVRIPQAGRLKSLNVAAAGALAMFEIARKREAVSGPSESLR